MEPRGSLRGPDSSFLTTDTHPNYRSLITLDLEILLRNDFDTLLSIYDKCSFTSNVTIIIEKIKIFFYLN